MEEIGKCIEGQSEVSKFTLEQQILPPSCLVWKTIYRQFYLFLQCPSISTGQSEHKDVLPTVLTFYQNSVNLD